MSTSSAPSPSGPAHVQSPENAFQTLKLPGLSTTADLRRVREQARVRQAMTKSNRPDSSSQVVERLLADPGFRLREAAAWYFGFTTHEGASTSDVAEVGPHDKVRALWHEINRHAQGGTGGFEGACRATAELANNPGVWLPLEQLIRDIADARLDSTSIPAVVEEATARWITEGLIALVRLHSRGYQSKLSTFCADAARIARHTDGLSERVVAIVVVEVLEKAADELESAANAFESEIALRFEEIEGGGSDGKALADAARKLVAGARPWSELVGVLDDDPYSGREGHALDRVAQLIRRTAVALYSHADDSSTAAQLLDFASYIAQSDSARESHRRDARTVRQNRYIRALNEAIAALNAWDIATADSRSSEVTRLAETEEERTQASELAAAVRRARSSQPMTTARERSSAQAPRHENRPVAAIVGGLVALVVVIGGFAMLVASGDESSTSNSNSSNSDSSNSGAGAPANGQSGVDKAAEGAALDREKARLDQVDIELTDRKAELDAASMALGLIAARYPNGMPSDVYNGYKSALAQYNAEVREYNNVVSQQRTDVDAYNRRVRAYNQR